MLNDKEMNLSSLGKLLWSDIPVMSTLCETIEVVDNITIRVTIGKTGREQQSHDNNFDKRRKIAPNTKILTLM